MQLKRNLLKHSNLYLILDRSVNDYPQLFQIAKKAISNGVDIIQLRDKQGNAREILKFSKSLARLAKGKVIFIVNDRVDIAKLAGADGVHLGQEDLSIDAARQILGKRAIIGQSCQTLKHARKALKDGADYIGFGSVFQTLTKPERSAMDLARLKRVLKNVSIPLFCIGGISLNNLSQLLSLGSERVAICRDICLAKDVKKVVRAYKEGLSV